MSVPPQIHAFLDNLVTEAKQKAGDKPSTGEYREEMISELYYQLDRFLTDRLLENLPTKDLKEFTLMAERGASKQEVERFLQTHVPTCKASSQLPFRISRGFIPEGVETLPYSFPANQRQKRVKGFQLPSGSGSYLVNALRSHWHYPHLFASLARDD